MKAIRFRTSFQLPSGSEHSQNTTSTSFSSRRMPVWQVLAVINCQSLWSIIRLSPLWSSGLSLIESRWPLRSEVGGSVQALDRSVLIGDRTGVSVADIVVSFSLPPATTHIYLLVTDDAGHHERTLYFSEGESPVFQRNT